MARKVKVELPQITIAESVYPYIAHFKEPTWKPVIVSENIPELPLTSKRELAEFFKDGAITGKLIRNYVKERGKGNRIIGEDADITPPLELVFYYLLSKKVIGVPYTSDDLDLKEIIIEREIEFASIVGFSDYKEYFDSKKVRPIPDIHSTYFALVSLHLLGALKDYLENKINAVPYNRKGNIVRFLKALIKNKRVYPYPEGLIQNSKIPEVLRKRYREEEFKNLYNILVIYQLLDIEPNTQISDFLPVLKGLKSRTRRELAIQLIIVNYLGLKGNINENILLSFHKYQLKSGGFALNGGDTPDPEDTYWVSYLMERFKWLLPYKAGLIYTFINDRIEGLNISEWKNNPGIFKRLALHIQTGLSIYETLLDLTEYNIFSHLENDKVIDLEEITKETELSENILNEIIPIIDGKYRFLLSIEDNEVRYKRIRNKLDPYQQKFADLLYDKMRNEWALNINSIKKEYNKGRPRDQHIEANILIDIIDRIFMGEKIFRALKIVKKGVFSKRYIYTHVTFIPNVLIADRNVRIDEIQREKSRLKEVEKDIYNMILEMEQSARNIQMEIESLIIIGDLNLAQKRMTANIKKAIFDASFFNKTIESSLEEFELIKPDILKPYIERWRHLYENLQKQYNNVKEILGKKIEQLRKENEQYLLTLELEEKINTYINQIENDLRDYEDLFQKKINTQYGREIIPDLSEALEPIKDKINRYDNEIKEISLKISSNKKEIKQKRKNAIDSWATHYETSLKIIEQYEHGLEIWRREIEKIDRAHKDFVKRIEGIGQRIHEYIKNKRYDDAYTLTEKSFPQILDELEEYTRKLKEHLESIYVSNRRLYALLRTVEMEWVQYQTILENLTQQFRTEFHSNIDLDFKTHLKEQYISEVNSAITELRGDLIDFEKRLNSLFGQDKISDQDQLMDEINKIRGDLNRNESKLNSIYEKALSQFPEIGDELKQSSLKWTHFKEQFEKELNSLTQTYGEQLLIHTVLKTADMLKTVLVPISNIAEKLNADTEKIYNDLKRLIAENRINAKIIGSHEIRDDISDNTGSAGEPQASEQYFIEIHNDIWRKAHALRQYTQLRLRELENRADSVEKFIMISLNQKHFTDKMDQIDDLINTFRDKVALVKDQWNLYLEKENIDPSYDIIGEIRTEFYDKIETFDRMIRRFRRMLKLINEYSETLDRHYNQLEDVIMNKIHYMYSQIQSINIKNYKRNIAWFNKQKEQINAELKEYLKEIDRIRNEYSKNEPKILLVLKSLNEQFKEKYNKLMESFENAMRDILDRISSLKLESMKNELENIITKYKNNLSYQLQKAEKEILTLMNIEDYIGAGSKLHISFQEQFEKLLKLYEKNIKSKYKEFVKDNPIFDIKYSYIIEQWEIFLMDFLNTLQETEIRLQKELIKRFIILVIESYKEEYVVIELIAKNLKFKENLVQHRIMSLIKNNELSGRIDLKHNLYLTEGATVDADIIDSAEALRAKNVRAYLMVKRFGTIFRYIAPIITIILSISSYIASQTSIGSPAVLVPLIISIIILLPIIVYSLYWFYKGKKKAIKGNLISERGKSGKISGGKTLKFFTGRSGKRSKTYKPSEIKRLDKDNDGKDGTISHYEQELTGKTEITGFSKKKD